MLIKVEHNTWLPPDTLHLAIMGELWAVYDECFREKLTMLKQDSIEQGNWLMFNWFIHMKNS